MGEQVQRVQTSVSESQMAQAIIEAWTDLFKTAPTREQVSIILAQNALETGNRKSMWNYNVGNIKADPKGSYSWFYLKGPEQTAPGKWEQLKMSFRAYPTLKDGVLDYLKLLSTAQRYSNAWQHILHPDPAAFSKALKQGGYYTADESAYTKLMSSLYNKFNKSDSYDAARSGQVAAPTKSEVATKDKTEDWMKGYMNTHQDKNIWEQLGLSSNAPAANSNPSANVDPLMDQFLKQLAASEKNNKSLYKKFLPTNNVLIKVRAADHGDAIEFSRILCSALDEELLAQAFTHTDGNQVEVEVAINGPEEICFEAVKQLSSSLSQVFKQATVKVGGIDIKTNCIMNKKSSYQQIGLKFANYQHRKFLLKFF